MVKHWHVHSGNSHAFDVMPFTIQPWCRLSPDSIKSKQNELEIMRRTRRSNPWKWLLLCYLVAFGTILSLLRQVWVQVGSFNATYFAHGNDSSVELSSCVFMGAAIWSHSMHASLSDLCTESGFWCWTIWVWPVFSCVCYGMQTDLDRSHDGVPTVSSRLVVAFPTDTQRYKIAKASRLSRQVQPRLTDDTQNEVHLLLVIGISWSLLDPMFFSAETIVCFFASGLPERDDVKQCWLSAGFAHSHCHKFNFPKHSRGCRRKGVERDLALLSW